MWTKTYSTKITGSSKERVWEVWTDVNQWHTWQDDIEYARMDGEFKEGGVILFKPKGGPKIKLAITKVVPGEVFVDCTRFPLAKMFDEHELITHGDTLEIKSTIRVEGLLSFVWRKLVAEDVANGLDEQTEKLIQRAQNG
jgi:uncharacterized protein YndB with AHSA1/START domain